jgi:hypothetical protein
MGEAKPTRHFSIFTELRRFKYFPTSSYKLLQPNPSSHIHPLTMNEKCRAMCRDLIVFFLFQEGRNMKVA